MIVNRRENVTSGKKNRERERKYARRQLSNTFKKKQENN